MFETLLKKKKKLWYFNVINVLLQRSTHDHHEVKQRGRPKRPPLSSRFDRNIIHLQRNNMRTRQ
jgi:hypothetical protein